MSKFPHGRSLIYEGNTLRVTAGLIHQGYQTTHLSVCPSMRESFPIAHADIIRITDVYGATIWENTELKEKKH